MADDFKGGHEADPGFWSEFRQFLDETKSWWMAPLILVFVLLSLLVVLSEGSPLAPFVYTLF